MPVKGLETYLLTEYPQACPRVRLKDLVDEYRAKTGRSEAVAVIELPLLMEPGSRKQVDPFSRDHNKRLKTGLLKYCRRLTDLGISPVFFMEGPAKKLFWVESSRVRTVKHVGEIYKCIARRARPGLPPGEYECAMLTLKQANFPLQPCGFDSMVRYALEHDCFCIMSRRIINFAMMPGAHYFLSMNHMKYFGTEDASTIIFDRLAIARALGLQPEHLQLLASFLNNDLVDGRYLLPLYRKLGWPPRRFIIPRLVTFINEELNDRQLERTGKDVVSVIISKTFVGLIPRFLRGLAPDLGLRDQFAMRDRLRDHVTASLVRYTHISPPGPPPPDLWAGMDTEVLELARTRHKALDFLSWNIMNLLEQRIMFMGPAREDPNLPDSCSTTSALRPFRRRMYGLLQVRGSVTECINAASRRQPCVVEVVEPICPDPAVHPHPGLLALWRSDQGDEDLLASKWRLFAWALSAHRPSTACVDELSMKLRALPRHLVVPASIVYLLYHSGALSDCGRPADELVRLFMISAVKELKPKKLKKQKQLQGLQKMQVHLEAIFMRAYTYVTILNDVLGAPITLDDLHPSLCFDKKLFARFFHLSVDLFDKAPILNEDEENMFMTLVTNV